jgi:hypothetical protein
MISPFDCVVAQEMGMAGAERKYLHRHCEEHLRRSNPESRTRKDWIASLRSQ